MNYQEELKKEYKNFSTWTSQFLNILNALNLASGQFIKLWVMLTGFMCILFILFLSSEIKTTGELITALKYIIMINGGVALVGVLTFYLPKKTINKFALNANYRVCRYKKIYSKVQNEISGIENVLLTHDLITQSDIENRKLKASANTSSDIK